ncbi:hypothetical protein [Chryseobacterium sp. FH1]|uniref:hypothetical protein n=1 Tax=Chryseobacterium sp. FH1 TaxID=1233951 RepID=UPI0004E30C21|nr:hypothetical protein [Chryseobacterium sp. FH1]KFC19456.1 hypothetical protein IO90_09170 [Chryseobacterium sp. FH1]
MRIPLLFLLILISTSAFSQQKESDIWSGSYSVHPNNDAVVQDTLVISRSKDLKPEDVPSKLEADLARWTVESKRDSKKGDILVRRFLQNDEDDEYKEFGWTALHKAGKMNCIDGGHFFICNTDPNSTVELKGDKPFKTESGIFGIWLHYGLVTLKKL